MNHDELHIIWLSIRVAILNMLITLPVATWIGWMLSRRRIPGKAIIEALISFPLVAPPVVTGYILLLLLGRNGLLGGWLYEHLGIRASFNFAAVVIASFVVSLPLAVRSIRSAFDLVDPGYETASLTLGHSKIRTFFRITLPMAFPGVLSGMVLSFARSLGEFGATITLAGNITGRTQTLATTVYSYMQVPGMEKQVARLVLISVLISLSAIAVSEVMNRRQAYYRKT
jgi:molybdate transport system permease protein